MKVEFIQGDVHVTYDPAKTSPDRLAESIRKDTRYQVTAIIPESGTSLLKESSMDNQLQTRVNTELVKLVFLTRDGCVNTPKMRATFDGALELLKWKPPYETLNVSKLPAADR